MEYVYIGGKELSRYLRSCLYAFNKDTKIRIISRGGYIKKAVDVAEIIKRQIIDPKVSVEIGSDKFEDRYVSTIEIEIEGHRKEEEK